MSEKTKFEVYKKKLQGICDENNLVFRFRNDVYPITLTIKPVNDLDAQMTMLENAEEQGFTSPDAYIAFSYKDGDIDFHMSDSFTISDVLFSKIKNLYKKMHSLWLQFFFRDIITNEVLHGRRIPQIEDKDETDDGGDIADPDYADEYDVDELSDDETDDDDDAIDPAKIGAEDPLFFEACQIVRADGNATTARLQRHFHVGYARAARLMDNLETAGVVGPFNGSTPREVIGFDTAVGSQSNDEGYDYGEEDKENAQQ